MSKFELEAVEKALDVKIERLRPEDVARIAQNAPAVEALLAELPDELERAKRQGRLLFDFLCAHVDAPPTSPTFAAVRQAAGALLYLSSPLDLVPDEEEEGYEDDVAILDLAVRRIAPELERFGRERGVDLEGVL